MRGARRGIEGGWCFPPLPPDESPQTNTASAAGGDNNNDNINININININNV